MSGDWANGTSPAPSLRYTPFWSAAFSTLAWSTWIAGRKCAPSAGVLFNYRTCAMSFTVAIDAEGPVSRSWTGSNYCEQLDAMVSEILEEE